jgi:nitroreductase
MRASRKIETAVNVLDTAIRSRKSIRAFRSDPVPKRLLMEIVDAARAAPSNFNSQPWRVYLLTGKAKDALSDAITRAYQGNAAPPFSPFPQPRRHRITQRALTSSAGGIIRRLALIGQI